MRRKLPPPKHFIDAHRVFVDLIWFDIRNEWILCTVISEHSKENKWWLFRALCAYNILKLNKVFYGNYIVSTKGGIKKMIAYPEAKLCSSSYLDAKYVICQSNFINIRMVLKHNNGLNFKPNNARRKERQCVYGR